MNLYLRLIYVSIVIILCSGCSKDYKNQLIRIDQNKDKVYLIFRGTNTKEGFFARDFNIKDTLSSHVGILIHNQPNWYVYNVSDFKDDSSDYKKQKIEDFFNFKKENIFYASLWKIEGLDFLKKEKLRTDLKDLEKFNAPIPIMDK